MSNIVFLRFPAWPTWDVASLARQYHPLHTNAIPLSQLSNGMHLPGSRIGGASPLNLVERPERFDIERLTVKAFS
jgi:hypothetical protein